MSDNPSDTGPVDGDSRRGFLKVIGIGGLGACAAGITAAPVLAAVAHPLAHETVSGGDGFIVAGKLSNFKPGEPVRVDLFADKRDAWNRLVNVKVGSVWVTNEGGKLTALSAVCPHLGCLIDYETAQSKFLCACHKSYFTKDGKVESGPSPRAMDDLEVSTKDEVVSIHYKRFKFGTATPEAV